MKLWHRHIWKLFWTQQGQIKGWPVTLAGYKCPCGKTKVERLEGFWSIEELSCGER